MTAVAVLGILSTVSAFLSNPLVSRLLQNLSHKTTNQIDDWVVDVICEAASTKEPAIETQKKLDEVQEKYDTLSDAEKTELRSTPSERAVYGDAG